ncbi:MAG: succinylglutamate desuccinylase/aspartoacylase family protein [Rhodospirillales bacterium]|nr:succinylglutamate desuccinylase/aspartoacylase family protein [Rhodospirillales bacterium]
MTEPTFEYPVELAPVDITPYRAGNTGVDYVTTFDSGVPGYHVMITAVTHGNELCGAITLDHFFKNDVRPIAGKITFAFANYQAYQSFDAADPSASRFIDEDMNRVWAADVLNGERDTVETRRARDLAPILDQADMLLDIHSMQHPTPALMLSGALAKGQQLAKDLAMPEYVVADEGHAAGKRMRDYGGFGDPMSEKNALLLEAGQHWEKNSRAVSIDTALRFLKLFGAIDMDTLMADHLALPDDQCLIEVTHPVTITAEKFRWEQTYTGFECIEKAGTLLGWNDDEAVRTPYDDCILIMPNRRLHKGQTAVRLGKRIN